MSAPFIIDVHTHLGEAQGFHAPLGSVDQFVSLMDATRTAVSIVVSMPLLARQFDLGYHEMTQAMERHPARIKAYTVFDPVWPDLSMKYIHEHMARPGFVGVKIHPTVHAVAPEDERYAPIWEAANQGEWVVLTHTWAPDPGKPTQNLATPDRFLPILKKHPRMKLILGHAGGRDDGFRLAIETVRQSENCWADISGDSYGYGHLEWLAESMGYDKILYGTDSNWIEPRYQYGHVLKSRLTIENKIKIFRDNALKLFGRHLQPC